MALNRAGETNITRDMGYWLFGDRTPCPPPDTPRAKVEAAIDYVIDLLDEADGDSDFEAVDGDGLHTEGFAWQGDHLLGDADDAEEETDIGAEEDEGASAHHGYTGSGAGCSVFDGI